MGSTVYKHWLIFHEIPMIIPSHPRMAQHTLTGVFICCKKRTRLIFQFYSEISLAAKLSKAKWESVELSTKNVSRISIPNNSGLKSIFNDLYIFNEIKNTAVRKIDGKNLSFPVLLQIFFTFNLKPGTEPILAKTVADCVFSLKWTVPSNTSRLQQQNVQLLNPGVLLVNGVIITSTIFRTHFFTQFELTQFFWVTTISGWI